MNNVIFYFSGTGNSLRAAQIIAKEIGGAKLLSMRSDPADVSVEAAEIIGFVCPVYEWDVPKTVRAFISQLTIDTQAYIFMVATYIAIHGRCFETVDSALRKKGGMSSLWESPALCRQSMYCLRTLSACQNHGADCRTERPKNWQRNRKQKTAEVSGDVIRFPMAVP